MSDDHSDHLHVPRTGCRCCNSGCEKAKSVFGNPDSVLNWPAILTVVGIVVFVLAIVALAIFMLNRRKKRNTKSSSTGTSTSTSTTNISSKSKKAKSGFKSSSKILKPSSKLGQATGPDFKVTIQK